jgi:hypothetical protein
MKKYKSRKSQHCPFKHNERVAALCRGDSKTPTKTVAVRATLVRFLFRKQVWLCETILVKNGGRIVKIHPKIKGQRRFLLAGQFLSDFENSRFILTRIVPRSHTCFRNKIPTSVAQTATIFV